MPRSASVLVLLEGENDVEVLAGRRAVDHLAVTLEADVHEAELAGAVAILAVPDAPLEVRGDVADIGVDHLPDLAGRGYPALREQDRAVAEVDDGGQAVADEDDGAALPRGGLHPAEALLLEGEIPHGENLVDDQDLGLQMSGHREGEAKLHPARVPLYGRIDERADVGELDNLIEAALDLLAFHAEDRAVQEDVLAPCELGVESGADLEQGPHAAAEPRLAFGRRGDPGEDLEQGALAGAVVADDAHRLASLDLEAHVAQRPELLGPGPTA